MTHIGIANWREEDQRLRLVITLELCIGDLGGDLAERGFQTVDHQPCEPGTLTFSATHEIIDRGKHSSARLVSCGAGLPEVPADAMWDDGWSAERYAHLREIGEHWHLNTMRAGCAHQTVVWETDKYGRRVPSLTLTAPCPVTGYKYGHAWLVEPLPADILAELSDLGVRA